jgi:hypothetical protein
MEAVMRKIGLSLVAAAFLFAPVLAQETQPTIRQFDIPTLEKLGHDMYVQDQAAWHATDALFALHPPAELVKENVHGWIVEDQPDGQLVRFIRDGDAGPEAAYDISNATGAPKVSVPQDRRLSDREKAQYAARTLAIKSVTQRCGDNYNTVVLKDPEGDGWLAWALAASTDPKLVMAGRHYRLSVSADGTQALRTDALSRSCLALRKDGAPAGATITGLFSTQIVSNIPVETFVFLSLQHHMPFFVGTPDRTVWEIAEGKNGKINLEKKTP